MPATGGISCLSSRSSERSYGAVTIEGGDVSTTGIVLDFFVDNEF